MSLHAALQLRANAAVADGSHVRCMLPNWLWLCDIDIFVDLDPEIIRTILDYADVKEFVADLFEGSVDVVALEGLKPYIRPSATADALYAF